MPLLSDILGLVGVGCILLAYFLLQTGRLTSRVPFYSWLNLGGALLILFSLISAWNLPAFVIECAWAFISAYKLWCLYLAKSAK